MKIEKIVLDNEEYEIPVLDEDEIETNNDIRTEKKFLNNNLKMDKDNKNE